MINVQCSVIYNAVSYIIHSYSYTCSYLPWKSLSLLSPATDKLQDSPVWGSIMPMFSTIAEYSTEKSTSVIAHCTWSGQTSQLLQALAENSELTTSPSFSWWRSPQSARGDLVRPLNLIPSEVASSARVTRSRDIDKLIFITTAPLARPKVRMRRYQRLNFDKINLVCCAGCE